MIDTVTLHIATELPTVVKERLPEDFLWNGIIFSPTYTPKGFIRSYSGHLENLFLTFNKNGLYLGNSWHKYYHGNNYNNYTYPAIVATYTALNERFNGLIETARIKRIDYGINLTADPAQVYGNWAYFRTKKPLSMSYKGKIYGKKFFGTEYNFKGYDKTAQIKYQTCVTLPYQITRIEKTVFKIRNLNRRKREIIPIFTGIDLTNRDIIRQLAQDFLKTYQNIEKMGNINLFGLTATEKKIIAAMQNPTVREAMKKENYETYRKDWKTYKDILERQTSGDKINYLITEKIMNLVEA